MSVFALRFESGRPVNPDPPTITILQGLQLTLEAVNNQAYSHQSVNSYQELVLLAIVLVNAVVKNTHHRRDYAAIAYQAAKTALSVIASMQNLRQGEFGARDKQELKFHNALQPHIGAMKRSLTEAVGTLTRTTKNAGFSLSLLDPSLKAKVDRISNQLLVAHRAFSLKVSLFTDQRLHVLGMTRDPPEQEGHILDWHQVELERTSENAIKDQPPPLDFFWDDAHQATIEGQKALVKVYAGKLLQFRRDLRDMRASRHGHLPALFGWSRPGISTPFIAVSIDSHRPLFEHISIICEKSPEAALGEVWKMLIVMRYTAEYLLSSGMVESNRALRETFKRAVVDDRGKVILAPRRYNEWPFGPLLHPPMELSFMADAFKVMYEDNVRGRRDVIEYGKPFPERIDHLPRPLRPLRYALIGNPAVILHSSAVRLSGANTQDLTLTRTGAIPFRSRLIDWPLAYNPRHYHPVVGDVGQFLRGVDGQVSFALLKNVQTEIGGYMYSDTLERDEKRISRTIWKLIPSRALRFFWSASLPPEIALRFLCTNAEQMAQEFGISPTDLVLVTETYISLDWHTLSRSRDGDSFIYVHFDEQGHPLHHYEATTPVAADSNDLSDETLSKLATNSPVRILPHAPPRYVQVEQHELGLEPNIAHLSSTKLAIGDIGYYVVALDGARQFHVVCNTPTELLNVEIQPWERNLCEDISGGVWRSQLIDSTTELFLRFSWTVKAVLNLPNDLGAFFLHSLASEASTKPIPAGYELQMVQKAYCQVQATFVPKVASAPLRLFIHFDESGIPIRTYWSSFDAPSSSLAQQTGPARCKVDVMPTVCEPPPDNLAARRRGNGHKYERTTGPPTPQSRLGTTRFLGQRIGDIGCWDQGLTGGCGDQWRHLGRVSPDARDLIHSTLRGRVSCSIQSGNIWRSRIPWDYLEDASHLKSARVHSRWIEELPHPEPSELADLADILLQKYGMSTEQLLIVSRVTTDVHGSASAKTLNANDVGPMPAGYSSSATESEDDPSCKTEPRPEDEVEPQYLDNVDDGLSSMPEDFWHELQMYAVLPPNGGCYAFWSSDNPEEVNDRALSRLDLSAWQLSGCDTSVSFDIQRTSLSDLLQISTQGRAPAPNPETSNDGAQPDRRTLVKRFTPESTT